MSKLPQRFTRPPTDGESHLEDGRLVWDEHRIDVRSPTLEIVMPLGSIAAYALTRSLETRRRLPLFGKSFDHKVHLELRSKHSARVRLTAKVNPGTHDELDGLPFERTPRPPGLDVSLDTIQALAALLNAHGTTLDPWEPGDAVPPEPLPASKPRPESKPKPKPKPKSKPKQKTKKETGTEGLWSKIALMLFFGGIIMIFGGINTCQFALMRNTAGELGYIFKDAEGAATIISFVRLDQKKMTHVTRIDLATGDVIAEAVAGDEFWSPNGFSLIHTTPSTYWFCNDEDGPLAIDRATLAQAPPLLASLEQTPAVLASGIGDPEWVGCSKNLGFSNDALVIKGKNAKHYIIDPKNLDITETPLPGVTPRSPKRGGCTTFENKTQALPWGGALRVGADLEPVSIVEDGRPPQPVGDARYLKAFIQRDAGDCTVTYGVNSFFVRHRETLDASDSRISRVAVSGEVIFTIEMDEDETRDYVGMLYSDKAIVLLWRGSSHTWSDGFEAAGFDPDTGKPLWREEY